MSWLDMDRNRLVLRFNGTYDPADESYHFPIGVSDDGPREFIIPFKDLLTFDDLACARVQLRLLGSVTDADEGGSRATGSRAR